MCSNMSYGRNRKMPLFENSYFELYGELFHQHLVCHLFISLSVIIRNVFVIDIIAAVSVKIPQTVCHLCQKMSNCRFLTPMVPRQPHKGV